MVVILTNDKILEMLNAELICLRCCTEVDLMRNCVHNCDDCEYAYAKGTIGERKEMLQSVIRIIEIIEKIKA